MVYPTFEDASHFCENDEPTAIEIHEFLARCGQIKGNNRIRFMVYPYGIDAYIVNTEKIMQDLEEELELIE